MGPKKSPFLSKTLWGAFIALSVGLLQVFGVEVLPEERSALEGVVVAAGAMLAIIGRFTATARLSVMLLALTFPLALGGCVAQQTDQQAPTEAIEQQDQIVDSYHNINIQLVIGGLPTTGEITTMDVDVEGATADTPSTMTATGEPISLDGLMITFNPQIWIDTAGGTERAGAGATQAGGSQEAGQEAGASAEVDATLTP